MNLRSFLSGTDLRSRSIQASLLTVMRTGGFKLLQLISNLILTRLLFPEAFGLMALATVFITGLSMISDVGIRPSVIRSERAEESAFQATAWTLQIVRGVILTVIAWLLAWPYAALYDQPILAPMIAVMAISTTIVGFESIEISMRQRHLVLGRVIAIHLAEKVVSVLITILLAWWLQSVWALVFGALSSSVFKVLLSYILLPSKNNRLAWNRDVLAEILTFGRWILVGTLFTFLGTRGLDAVRGLFVDLETLAFLTIATQFGWMIGEFVAALIGGVVFPALSKITRERPEDLARQVRRIRILQFATTVPALLLLSVLAQPLIDFLYDPRYADAGVYLAFIALNSVLGTLTMVYMNAFLAMGDSRAAAIISGIEVAARLALTFVGYHYGGVIGMLAGFAVATLIANFLAMGEAWRKGFANLPLDFAIILIVPIAYGLQLSGKI